MIIPHSLQEIRVLIVDDNISDRLVLKTGLKSLGFRNIHEAEDGSIAQYKINNAITMGEDFELLFIDLRMPRQNGMLLLERLRTHTKTNELYIVMVTGSADLESVEDAKRNGVDDFMVKPVDIDTLRIKLETFLDKRHKDLSSSLDRK